MTNKEKIKGIIVPIITPMDENESINEQELRNQVDRLIAGGIDGIFTFGTNGEGYILNDDEKETVLSIVIKQVNGRVPVYAGTGCISTRDTIKMSKMAQRLGADVLSVITPYFAQASQEEIAAHYTELAKNVDLPIVLYNIPARTGNAIAPETVKKLSDIENIVGVKDSSGNFTNMLSYIDRTKDKDFAVLSGNDSLILWNLIAGGTGAIAGCANVYPETISEIYDSFMSGNTEKAKECQAALTSFRNCFKYGNSNTVIKAAMELLGYPVGLCRKPFNIISNEGIEALKKIVAENKENGMR